MSIRITIEIKGRQGGVDVVRKVKADKWNAGEKKVAALHMLAMAHGLTHLGIEHGYPAMLEGAAGFMKEANTLHDSVTEEKA